MRSRNQNGREESYQVLFQTRVASLSRVHSFLKSLITFSAEFHLFAYQCALPGTERGMFGKYQLMKKVISFSSPGARIISD